MLFRIKNDIVKLKAKQGFASHYVLDEALNFIYDNHLESIELIINGESLKLTKDQDLASAYEAYRKTQKRAYEEAAQFIPDIEDNFYPFEVLTALNLEMLNDSILTFAVEDAINFVNKYNIESVSFKTENRIVNIRKDSDIYTVCDKLKKVENKDLGEGK